MKRSRLVRKQTTCPKVRLKHGDLPDSMFDPKWLAVGTKIEMEHTNDPEIAKQIAKSHLHEFSLYYKYLPRLEKAMKTNWVVRKAKQKVTPSMPNALLIY